MNEEDGLSWRKILHIATYKSMYLRVRGTKGASRSSFNLANVGSKPNKYTQDYRPFDAEYSPKGRAERRRVDKEKS